MELIFEGKITHISQTEEVGQNNLPKRSFVLEEVSDREYKGSIALDLYNEKTWLMDQYSVWDTVKAYFNVRAREYNDRRYNSLSARKVEQIDGSSEWGSDPIDDLPF